MILWFSRSLALALAWACCSRAPIPSAFLLREGFRLRFILGVDGMGFENLNSDFVDFHLC